jgi:hypothetical protein
VDIVEMLKLDIRKLIMLKLVFQIVVFTRIKAIGIFVVEMLKNMEIA